MELIDREENDYQFRCTEIDFWINPEIIKSTVQNLAKGILRAKRLSQIKKERKPKIKKKVKNPKKSK